MDHLSRSCAALAAAQLLLSAFFTAQPLQAESDAPIHYYDAAIGKTGPALKAALQSIIRNHTVIPYTAATTDTWDALKVLDQDPLDADSVLLIYSGLTALKSEQYTGSVGTWEREHLWPQSYGITALSSSSRAMKDLFNLRPIDRNVNGSRGNKFYDISTAPFSMHPEASGSTYDSNSWEARAADKGAIARSMFYMAVRYDGSDSDVPDLELSDSP
ncbi:MAG TPA: endonuclease, partial [Chthoniobacterales bacterium]